MDKDRLAQNLAAVEKHFHSEGMNELRLRRLPTHYQAWERATHRAPDGKPIELKSEDFGQ